MTSPRVKRVTDILTLTRAGRDLLGDFRANLADGVGPLVTGRTGVPPKSMREMQSNRTSRITNAGKKNKHLKKERGESVPSVETKKKSSIRND